jgi:hypothetical protein
MSTSATIETTHTVGFFNANKWPIQLVISRFNITLHLQPGEYILDKEGRKINDPFFEAYAKTKQLARETSVAPVGLVRIPLPTSGQAIAVPDGQSVRAVTQFTSDTRGQRVPIIPAPKSFPDQTINKAAVIPMSMDEARKAGLVQRVREVPEDFGAPDSDGAPPRKVPTIRYAMDSTRGQKPTALPPQVMENVPPGREALVTQLNQAVQAPVEAENAAIFMNTVTPTAPPGATVTAGAPSDSPLPPPSLDDADTEQPEPGTMPLAVPPPPVEESTAKYACVACGKGFPFRSQLERHAKQVHRSDFDAVMAPYPEAR